MRADELLQTLTIAGRLKQQTRHCWIEDDRKESVADHSWRIALMVLLIEKEPEFAEVDMNKVMRMCLIHDLGEAFTGDIPAFYKNGEDEGKEEEIYRNWIASFNEKDRKPWSDLLEEMISMETKEARVYKALDKIEAIITHNETDIKTWLPLEYDLQKTYGKEQMNVSPFFLELRELVDAWTDRKIKEEKRIAFLSDF